MSQTVLLILDPHLNDRCSGTSRVEMWMELLAWVCSYCYWSRTYQSYPLISNSAFRHFRCCDLIHSNVWRKYYATYVLVYHVHECRLADCYTCRTAWTDTLQGSIKAFSTSMFFANVCLEASKWWLMVIECVRIGIPGLSAAEAEAVHEESTFETQRSLEAERSQWSGTTLIGTHGFVRISGNPCSSACQLTHEWIH